MYGLITIRPLTSASSSTAPYVAQSPPRDFSFATRARSAAASSGAIGRLAHPSHATALIGDDPVAGDGPCAESAAASGTAAGTGTGAAGGWALAHALIPVSTATAATRNAAARVVCAANERTRDEVTMVTLPPSKPDVKRRRSHPPRSLVVSR